MDARVGGYLAQLGLSREPPTGDYLRRIHRAHAARFAHDTLWMVRDRVPDLVEDELVDRLLAGEGGACMQLNVSLGWLLRHLGYAVTLHSATAQSTFQLEASRHTGDHCVLTVALPQVTMLVDCGTGTGHCEPLPLSPGEYQQGPFRYRVVAQGGGRWRVEHDRRPRALRGVELTSQPARLEDFEPLYRQLSCGPDSPYRRAPWAQRRTPTSVELLHLRTLRVRTAAGWQVRHLATAAEWREELRTRFGLRLPDLDEAELGRLWALTGDLSPRGLTEGVVGAACAGGLGDAPA